MRKVQKIQVIVVPKYITEDREIRLYLAPVKKRTLQRLWNWIKRRVCRLQEIRLHYVLCRWFLIISLTYLVGLWAIADAYRVRGYWAYGGEYFFIMMVFYALVQGSKFISKWRGDYDERF